MKGALPLLRFLMEAADRGERTALVTVTDVIGSGSRAPGTHMAVSETGASHGSLSGGCVEAAVIAEAQRVIAQGRAETVRFGAGSSYIDIRLPCGGGIDLLLTPQPSAPVIADAWSRLADRRSVFLSLGRSGTVSLDDAGSMGWSGDCFGVRHDPDLRLCIVGHGAETIALARLALAHGAGVTVLSPDAGIVETTADLGAASIRLKTPAASPHLMADAHTAIVMLFHDHDWEGALLAQALDGPAFYVGAMGSRATHAKRLADLRQRGVSADDRNRLAGPIGLLPASRDPETLALSVLAEVVAVHQERSTRTHDAPSSMTVARALRTHPKRHERSRLPIPEMTMAPADCPNRSIHGSATSRAGDMHQWPGHKHSSRIGT